MTKKEQRSMMVSDVQYLERILDSAHYNSKVNLIHLSRGFSRNFPAPNATAEESKAYFLNNLILIRDRLNELDLGVRQDVQDNNVPF